MQTDTLVNEISGHSFNTSAGLVTFDEQGERIVQYDIRQIDQTTGIFRVRLT